MSMNVDIDEADVAVLNKNLVRSKELFNSISQSLNRISNKASTASTKIKPIIRDVNKLTDSKKQVENGLLLLEDVSRYAEETSGYEVILSSSIEGVGLKKYIITLVKSKALLKEMKAKIKGFKGILINFENLIDKSDMALQNYFQKLVLNAESKIEEFCLIFKYFELDLSYINRIFVRIRGGALSDNMKPYENITFIGKKPYEKGTNGVQSFNNELIGQIDKEVALIDTIRSRVETLDDDILSHVIEKLINENYNKIVISCKKFLSTTSIIDNDIIILELIDCILTFENYLSIHHIDVRRYGIFNENFTSLLRSASDIFKEYIKLIESRISNIEKLNDSVIPEVTVEIISKIRRASEYPNSLMALIKGHKLGDWLLVNPPVKFTSVYTSVIPNAGNGNENLPEFHLGCFFSDAIDAIMINIEIGLKNDVSIKKSTQGFYLVKNLIMIETIINRSQQLFKTLGNLGLERINKLKNRFLKLFLDDWNYASYIIIRDMTSIATTNAQNGGGSNNLSNKERDQIKELFKTFNESFEEALKNYQKYNITDPNLKTYLGGEIKKLILNAYFKLYDKYGRSDFTKNKPKYVKYDKQQFESLLNRSL